MYSPSELEACSGVLVERAEHSEGRVVTDGLEIKQALVTLTEKSNQMGPKEGSTRKGERRTAINETL